jgi:hypothetical protein
LERKRNFGISAPVGLKPRLRPRAEVAAFEVRPGPQFRREVSSEAPTTNMRGRAAHQPRISSQFECFGSLRTLRWRVRGVRFTPEGGQVQRRNRCPLTAVTGHPRAARSLRVQRPRPPPMNDPCNYWLAAGAGMVTVLTLRAPGHAGGGCGSDAGPAEFGSEAPSPSGYCEGGSNEFEYCVCPWGGGFRGAKSAVDACQGREQPPPTTKSAEARMMAAFTRMTYAARFYFQDGPRYRGRRFRSS